MSTPPNYPSAPPPPPPGPPSYPPQAAQSFFYRPLQARLTAVKVVFVIIAAVSVLAALSDVLEILMLNQLIAGEDVSESRIDANDIRQGLAGTVQFAALVAGTIAFIMWLFRAYQNTDAVAPMTRRWGHGWSIGAWFVPFLNLWRPKQIVNDVWRAGGPPAEPPALLTVWWTFWIVTGFVANFATNSIFSGDDYEDLRGGSYGYLVSDLLDAVAALLAIAVAVQLTRRLDARAAEGPPAVATA